MPSSREEEYLNGLCKQIMQLDNSIRFAGIANNLGSLVATAYRNGLIQLMNRQETSHYAIQAVLRATTREDFESKIGRLEYSIGKYMVLNAFPTLFGVLVNLRELSMNDAQAIADLMNYNISKYLYKVPDHYSVQDALNFIKKAHNDFESLRALHFAVEYKDMSELRNNNYPVLVGSIGLKNIDLINKKADLGYWIGEKYWSRGIATECVGLIIDYAFSSSDLGLRELIAYVFPENKASIRVLEKNGMKNKGKVNEYHEISKRYRTSLQYIIMKSDREGN